MSDSRIVQNGYATIPALAGGAFSGLLAGLVFNTADLTQNFKIKEIEDGADFDYSLIAGNEFIELDFNVSTTAATKALAIANGIFLLPLASVQFTGFDLPFIGNTGFTPPGGSLVYTGNWINWSGAKLSLNAQSICKGTYKFRKYADPTQNALLNARAA